MEKTSFPILPSNLNRIGILGGGQLGKMIAISANNLGFQTLLYCPKGDNPAETAVNKVLHGSWYDFKKIDEFASQISCATSEFENVPSETLDRVAKKSHVFPNSIAFKNAQNRDKEKILAQKVGFKLPKWYKVNNIQELKKFSEELEYNAILKTNSLGYDGKGQKVIKDKESLQSIWSEINCNDCILEEKINFKREISILYAKSADNSDCFFPLSENIHEKGILRTTYGPVLIDKNQKKNIKMLTKNLATKINLIGLLAIEMFQLENGEIIFNEIAPRPHNSFHWTIEGCLNSQFDILVKCICGLPIHNESSSSKWKMVNIIGKEIENLNEIINEQNYKCHIYGKKEIKKGRKMGHFTIKLS